MKLRKATSTTATAATIRITPIILRILLDPKRKKES
jgi:hypothetical protein